MFAQFIPSPWPVLLPILIVLGLPIAIVIYRSIVLRLPARLRLWKANLVSAVFSVLAVCCLFYVTNYASWRWRESVSQTALQLRAAADRKIKTRDLVSLYGEPGDIETGQAGEKVYVYSAIIKYDSGRWGVGTVGVQFDASGRAYDTWTAD